MLKSRKVPFLAVGLCSVLLVAANLRIKGLQLDNIRPRSYAALNRLPFDLFSSGLDLNGIMTNPQWGTQVDSNQFPNPNDMNLCPQPDFGGPSCSSQPRSIDKPHFPHSAICGLGGVPKGRIKGHVNWTAATYDGTVFFNDYSDDFDYTLSFKPKDGAGLTTNNPGTSGQPEFIHAEFYAPETIDGFLTSTWTTVRDGIECFEDEPDCPDKTKKALEIINGRRAVITGLMGLDSEHGSYSELHPVYALAIEVNSDPSDDIWIFFIRNRGNEGFCSSHDHPLEGLSAFTLLLPKPPGAEVTDGVVTESSFASTIATNCPVLGFDQVYREGELVRFNLPQTPVVPRPFHGPIVEGEVHIKWVSAGTLNPFQRDSQTVKPEKELDEHFLTPAQKKKYRQNLKKQGLQMFAPLAGFTMCSASSPNLGLLAAKPTSQGKQGPVRIGTKGRPAVERNIRLDHDRIYRGLCLASNYKLTGCKRPVAKSTKTKTN
jgi:hypothetical protein